LEETKLEPHYLELEITESIVQNIDESLCILKTLKSLGVQISLDDFGTGYSSLSYLRHLPVDTLKIDKSFIDDINTNEKAIVKTIIDMANNLEFEVIAEGIENKKQLTLLNEMNCGYGQGYLFSKPLAKREFENLLKQRSTLNLI
jgi:EAL domain-containing protein (putative c-di-GMP-specific phosphodiesterase class I)